MLVVYIVSVLDYTLVHSLVCTQLCTVYTVTGLFFFFEGKKCELVDSVSYIDDRATMGLVNSSLHEQKTAVVDRLRKLSVGTLNVYGE